MNAIKYFISKSYRGKHSEEYAKEFIGRFELQQQEYEKIYSPQKDENSNTTT